MDYSFFGLVLILSILEGINSQARQPRCEQGSCYPATGDLLIGRSEQLNASSTCGLEGPEKYCIVSHLEEVDKCFQCDSTRPWSERNRNSHRIDNVVSSFRERKRNRWWQAVNGKQHAYIQLDLEAEFHFTHLIMTFKTFRPRSMLVERSYDFGKTWKVYRYFAYNCEESFPGVKRGPVRKIDDVICTNRYSEVEPSTGGEVIFRVLPPFIPISDPYSEKVQDLLKLTNLRVNFTELHTLGDTLLDTRTEIIEKYYYALYDMTVRGSCSCYGHASRCVPVPGYSNYLGMVHGQCLCAHNTQGRNCEMCQDQYNDVPWQPARQFKPHECQRCKCNNHADKCRFDPAVYEKSGRISGGVCLECKHNTMGKNCQECRPFFFQHPNRDIRDPEICQPCDCDPDGSEFDGQCDRHTDPQYGLEAGRCTCKRNVEGKRCDTCKDGFWKMDPDNKLGCEPCACNTLGTVGNFGCDKDTGQCYCKRYVIGSNCDQCYPGTWNLSESQTGCTPCECDLGGASSEECELRTGQCVCRPNIVGRRCDQPRPGFFFTLLDYFIYEAEHARGIGRTRLFMLPAANYSMLPWRQQWTGPGFMRVTEGDSLEFKVDNIDFPTNYDIVIRYNPAMREVWEDVKVYVIRPGPVDKDGLCANHMPGDDEKSVLLFTNKSYAVVSPPACLEPGIEYTIRLDFNRYKTNVQTPDAVMNIDSIILVPNMDTVPIFQGQGYPNFLKEEYLRYGCYKSQLKAFQDEPVDICRNLTFSISSVLHGQALPCECSLIGSEDVECNPVGGQCRCKQNVVGRQCDRCASGTFNFGPDGCRPCNCHEYGSQDNFCDQQTGQCLCIRDVGNRICDRCNDGFWGFPQCRPCQCNGNADVCDNLTGACLSCRNYTTGDNCGQCLPGYHGDPRINYRVPCQPCLCPGGPDSPIQHADSCYEDPLSRSLKCNCRMGYDGANCDRCANNYYGKPHLLNGTCDSCFCNDNIDPSIDGNCNTTTGECLRCQFNTVGYSCERCLPGFYGDATVQNCQACVCNRYGTDSNAGVCDGDNGQCPCLPNVQGKECDTCLPGFWNITSGEGCSSCNCDPTGSRGAECNQFDGQCDCVPGRGGQDCSQCEDFFWGDPTVQCYPCDCNSQGSDKMQCDRLTGQCMCLPGISGYKCDRCDRGTTGVLPNCKPCGECFDNWDRVIRDLSARTTSLIDEATKIKATGVEKAFDNEFREMERNMDEIKEIVNNASTTSSDIKAIEDLLEQLRQNMTNNMVRLDNTSQSLNTRMDNIRTENNVIRALQNRIEELKKKITALIEDASRIRAQDVEGAFNITREAQQRSRMAQRKVDETQRVLDESENIRRQTENILDRSRDAFNDQVRENDRNLKDVDNLVSKLSNKIADINEMVCDGRGDPCDDVCGGGGCGKCGGVSCDDGAVTQANNAIDLAEKAENILQMKEDDANELIKNIQTVQQGADEAKGAAQMAYNEAMKAKNKTENARTMLQDLLNRISEFLGPSSATPEDVKMVAEEVLAMTISLSPEQIMDLSKKIDETIAGLQNIDSILNATSDDLAVARKLKERAEMAEADANTILGKATDVLNNLKGATEAQEKAEQAITKADKDISDAEADLTQIESETAAAADKSNKSLDALKDLYERVLELRNKYTGNQIQVQQAEKEAKEAEELAADAEAKANELDSRYSDVAEKLDTKYNSTSAAQKRAQKLKDRADKLAGDTTAKLQKLQELQNKFKMNNQTLQRLSLDIDKLNADMDRYLKNIQDKADFYFKCK